MRIDLHAHSDRSDGSSPADLLVQQAAAAGLDVVALTDHDTTAGWDLAAKALPPGLTLIRGAELSCCWFPTPDTPISIHLLAYLFDPLEPRFAAGRAAIRRFRLTRGERIVELMRADGVDIDWPAVVELANGAPIGRPHIGLVLVERGIVADLQEAFKPEWMGNKYCVPNANIEIFDAIKLVLGAGGVPVIAHPKAEKRGHVVPDDLISALAAAGLAGLEADHANHSPQQREHLRTLASQLGLFTTGSSDFHGVNKPIALGENATTTVAVYEQIVTQARGCTPL